MNTYSWVQPTSSQSLSLQKDGNPVIQITKEGGIVSNFALFTSLLEDSGFEGNILVVDANGMVRKAPITLNGVSKEINDHLNSIHEEIKKALQKVQIEEDKAIKKLADDTNIALSTIQKNQKYDLTQVVHSTQTDSRLQRITMLERMTWVMFVLIILLLLAVIRLFLKK